MTTIDNFDISVHFRYALMTQVVEEVRGNYFKGIQGDAGISSQVQLLNFYLVVDQLDLLMGVASVHTPWALFSPPNQFHLQRRSPFTFSRLAPSIFDLGDSESGVMERLKNVEIKDQESEKEKGMLLNFMGQVRQINEWIGFAVGRMGQFLQG